MNEKNIINLNPKDPSSWSGESLNDLALYVRECGYDRHNPIVNYFFSGIIGRYDMTPVNTMLRDILLNNKKMHQLYKLASDDDFIQAALSYIYESGFDDWNPARESFHAYIGSRLRENTPFGQKFLKSYGCRKAYLVGRDENGMKLYLPNTKANRDAYIPQGFKLVYANNKMLSADETRFSNKNSNYYSIYDMIGIQDDQAVEDLWYSLLRPSLMEICHITEFQMQICEAISIYGKSMDTKITDYINHTIVIPSGRTAMTQTQISRLNRNVHNRAMRYREEIREKYDM
jgi:hypothetical protein